MLVESLYSDINELYLDFNIFGEIISAPQQSLDELREMYFEEFTKTKPMPTLESRRYELSNPVSEDYIIDSFDSPLLSENEHLITFSGGTSQVKIDFPSCPYEVPDDLRAMFTIENSITNSKRDAILAKYNISTDDIISDEQSMLIETMSGTVKQDKSTYLSEEEADKLLLVPTDSVEESEITQTSGGKNIDMDFVVSEFGLEEFDDSLSSSQATLDFLKEFKGDAYMEQAEKESTTDITVTSDYDDEDEYEADYSSEDEDEAEDDADYEDEDEYDADYEDEDEYDADYEDEDEYEADYGSEDDTASEDDTESDADYEDEDEYDTDYEDEYDADYEDEDEYEADYGSDDEDSYTDSSEDDYDSDDIKSSDEYEGEDESDYEDEADYSSEYEDEDEYDADYSSEDEDDADYGRKANEGYSELDDDSDDDYDIFASYDEEPSQSTVVQVEHTRERVIDIPDSVTQTVREVTEAEEAFITELSSDGAREQKRVDITKTRSDKDLGIDIGFSEEEFEQLLNQNNTVARETTTPAQMKPIVEVPTDLRKYLRMYPNSKESDVLKYFSKKEIDKEVMRGRIIRRKGTLRAI